MNSGFRQTHGDSRRNTDSRSMRSGEGLDRTHQGNRPRNRRYDPSRAAFYERNNQEHRENHTDAHSTNETIVLRNNQEHGENHTDAPPAYDTIVSRNNYNMNSGFRQIHSDNRRNTDNDSRRSRDRTHQGNGPRNRRFDPSRAAFYERNNQEQAVGGNANLGMQGDRAQQSHQGQNEVGDNLERIVQTTKRFMRRVAEYGAPNQIPAADVLMFRNWLYHSNGELNPTRASILADLEQQYNQQASKVKSSESHFLTFFLEVLKEGMRQKEANLPDSVDLVQAQNCQVDLTHAEVLKKEKSKSKKKAHDAKSSAYEASYQEDLEELENRTKEEEMDEIYTKNLYLESKLKKKVDMVDLNTSELPDDERGELGSIVPPFP